MIKIWQYTLLALALGFGLLPAGRSLSMLVGGCDTHCCDACSPDCCSEHTPQTLLTCPNCKCTPTEYAIQTVPLAELKQHLQHSVAQNSTVVFGSAFSRSANLAASNAEVD